MNYFTDVRSHNVPISELFPICQIKSEINPLGINSAWNYVARMKQSYTNEKARKALMAFMEHRDIKGAPWCKRARIDEGTLRKFLDGTTNSISTENFYKLAEAENTTIDDILNYSWREDSKANNQKLRRVPIAGSIPGMNPLDDKKNSVVDQYAWFETEITTIYALKLTDDSMDKYIPEGALLFIDHSQTDISRINGKIVILVKDGIMLCRKIKNSPLRMCPESSNSKYEDYFPAPGDDWKIAGVVIGHYVKY